MDGVRGYWNGQHLFSRHGRLLSNPEWFTSALPLDMTLDGELWMGHGATHEDVHRLLHSTNGDWSKMEFYVFDMPSSPETYEVRMKEMESLRPVLPSHIKVVENTKCTGATHLRQFLDTIAARKGEGIILREPHSLYTPGSTVSLLKVKVTQFSK